MNKTLFVLVVLGILISVAFAADTVQVQYATKIVNDGELADWSGVTSEVMVTSTNYLYFGVKEDSLCSAFYIRDVSNNGSKDYIKFVFDLDKDGKYSQTTDFGRAFTRDGKVYVLNDTWEQTTTIQNPSLFSYATKELGSGWQAELCMKYNLLGITPGVQKNLKFASTEWNGPNFIGGWPSEGWGVLSSGTNWMSEGWCNANSDCGVNKICVSNACISQACSSNENCADNQYCAPTAAGDKCLTVQNQSDCGYVSGHAWHDYTCCFDSDCGLGKACANHVCNIINQCTNDENCADDQYCAPAAMGNKCLAVQSQNPCGYVSGHAWHAYECCDDSACAEGMICKDHTCTEAAKPPAKQCTGKVQLDLAYVGDKKAEIKVFVSGLTNCEGNTIIVRKNNCSEGAVLCAATISSAVTYCAFDAPSPSETVTYNYTYAACVDMDKDGIFATAEQDKEVFSVVAACTSNDCTPAEWSICTCDNGNTRGEKYGICADNCGKEISKTEECNCAVVPPKPEPIAPIDQPLLYLGIVIGLVALLLLAYLLLNHINKQE